MTAFTQRLAGIFVMIWLMACTGRSSLPGYDGLLPGDAGEVKEETVVRQAGSEQRPDSPGESTQSISDVGEAADSHQGYLTNALGMDFVWIPPGIFHMGSHMDDPDRYDDETRRKVTISRGFFLMATEVTQGQWEKVMGNNPSGFRHCGSYCPVERVSWNDVQVFIQKLQAMDKALIYRLPTEAEWEYAARGGSQTAFAFGRCLDADAANYNGRQPLAHCSEGRYREGPTPVGSFSPNAFGLHDMHGNVWEWCQDVYAPYDSEKSVVDPLYEGPGDERVIRGGSWYGSARSCRSAGRGRYAPDRGFNSIGFRLAAEKPD
ncbi:formylglycine-generating enzyme family protein [Desulfobotulus sp. H1]|uniref:Formylglycine-generating enzyme family protein n=1 Tax=Desulfobotulus pelophilus TaxID=2823377 RepID=A0ABT3N5B6_9BACT|nr:formylglycine-generating enzyme family protein [Desulfobotulus pelophilus]MCW7752651.1 formylglycine-generating enzyme family protein [Desulfobotulus pelophilus]